MNVLLLTIDALRRDRCLKVMHRFQRWAKENAVFFANHYSVAHCSDPNYMTMLSGLIPDNHGIYSQIRRVEEDKSWEGYPKYPNIPAWLRLNFGHRCGGYTATYPKFYFYGFSEVTHMGRNVKTDPSWGQLKRFVEDTKQRSKPWYFFVRTMDCHQPYMKWRKNKHVRSSYNGAVRFTDGLVMDLINWVLDKYPNTLIVFCSDHGELLGEHGYKEHFSTLYQELLRIPMYWYWPGCPGGTLVEEFTQHQDIFPTLIDLFDTGDDGYAKHTGHMDGKSMLWAMEGETLRDRMTFVAEGVLAEAYQQHRALIRWPWKYIATAEVEKGPIFELYNLEDDPQEKNNLALREPDLTLKMSHELATTHRRARKFVRPDTVQEWEHQYREVLGVTKEEAREIKERLRALGYAG